VLEVHTLGRLDRQVTLVGLTQLGPEIWHAIKHCRPVPANLLPSCEGPVQVHRLFAVVAGVEAV
jgi:hypothetical protein